MKASKKASDGATPRRGFFRRVGNWILPVDEGTATYTQARERLSVISDVYAGLLRGVVRAWRARGRPDTDAQWIMPTERQRRELLGAARKAWLSGAAIGLVGIIVVASWAASPRHLAWWQVYGMIASGAGLLCLAGFVMLSTAADARSLMLLKMVRVGDVLRRPGWWAPWGHMASHSGPTVLQVVSVNRVDVVALPPAQDTEGEGR